MDNELGVIVIDGPAGAGKSTIAKLVAKKLGIAFLDTGAMYRSVTVKGLRQKVNWKDSDALEVLAKSIDIALVPDSVCGLKVFLDGEDVTEEIRTQEVTNNTFYVAREPKVRAVMVELQQRIGEKGALVGDGRDLGTVVFPKAAFKFYLDADFDVRAQRRIDELRSKGQEVDVEALKKDLAERDRQDFSRAVGPLKQAADAIIIDSTHMFVEEVVDKIISIVKA